MRKIFILIVLLAAALPSSAGGKQSKALSDLLFSCMQVEDVHPDSLEHNIERLKLRRMQSADPTERAVYAAAIGRYYAERLWVSPRYEQWRDSMMHWYGKALADKALLARTKARKWKPFVTVGKDEDYFGGDMLNVVWRSMTDAVPRFERDTLSFLPKTGEMIDFYRRNGQREAALLLTLDSLSEASGDPSEEALLRVRDEYADLPLCAEVYLRLAARGDVPAARQREWLQQGIGNYPRYRHIAALRNALTRLSDPFFRWDGSTDVYPGKTYRWTFNARNIRSVSIDGKVHDFGEHDPIEAFTDSMEWTAPAAGDCEIVFVLRTAVSARLTGKIKPLKQKIRVSALQAVVRMMSDNRVCLLVLDSETGAPQEGVTVTAYELEKNDSVVYFTGLTDRKGRVYVPRVKNKSNGRPDNRLHFRMSRPGEEHLPVTTIYVNNEGWQGAPKDSTRRLTLFTDRSIYRPGQTVHVSGIAYRQLDWAAQVAAGENYTLTLYDATNKKVEEKAVSSDEMGVFASDFVLPTGLRNGTFSIGTSGARVFFRVEEYKRPTFEIVLDDSLYVEGDSCVVRGRALHYDGTPLRAARVTGTYRWQPSRYFYYNKVRPQGEIQRLDTLETDDRGQFAYKLKIDRGQGDVMPLRSTLSVTVDVLSQQGETHHAENWYWRTNEAPLCSEQERVDSAFIVRCENGNFAPGSPGRITVTTNLSDVYLHYTLSAAGEVWMDSMVCLDHETYVLDIPYEEKYDQSVSVSFCFVKGGRVYNDTKQILLAQPDERLRPHWDTFRNLLQPGQREEWRLTLRRPDGTPADANLMVTLYDASLDYFARHAWNFGAYRSYRTYSVSYRPVWREHPNYEARVWYNQKLKKEPGIRLSAINTSLYNVKVYSPHLYSGKGARRLMEAKVASTAQMRLAGAAPGVNVRGMELYESAATTGAQYDSIEEDAAEMAEEESGESAIRVPMRENFNETAFFYPRLRTDKNGQVTIAFTLPESLTRWNLIGIAHTQDMMSARIGEQIEARKDLMAQLFLPRFLRPGDEAVLVATVRNVSDTVQQGKAVLQVLDAGTEKVLKSWKTNIALESKQDTVLRFPYAVADNPLAASADLIVRWAVEGTTCSDGEQRLLPVLSPTEKLTNTVAITAYEPGVTNIDLSSLFPAEVTNRRLTVEYTTRPEQYALQALPVMAKAGREDILSVASAYYAGVLGRSLHVDMPDSTEVYYRKMRELQNAEGGFAWYPQMPASTYLTAEVAYMLTRLHMLTGEQPARDVNEKAIHYLLSQRVDSVVFSAANLRTLYVALYSDTGLSKAEKKKVDFLLRLAKKAEPEDMGYEGQALLALVWQKEGESRKARKCVELFRKRLVSSPEGGSYIEFPKGSFVSIDRKLHIHVQMMEALQRVMPDSTRLLRDMRRYLLQQKRTQEWTTPVNSANAVFALLTISPAARPASPAKDLLTLTRQRGTAVNFTADDDTLGYLRDSMLVQEGKLPVRLRLHKFSDGESWGGVFAEYEQPFSQVKAHSMGLSVVQEYPKEVKTGSRYTVRYRISADRDYEYVTLVAPRPAFTEPVNQRSGYGWNGTAYGWGAGLGYYRQVHDATTEFSFHHIPRGEYVIEETLYVERGGRYHSGIAVIRCEYADEFRGHSDDSVVEVAQ